MKRKLKPFKLTFHSLGQTMVEIIIVVGIVLVILTVVVVNSVNSLKTSNFTSSKSLATSYAKEGIELARSLRDAGWYAFESKGNVNGIEWCVDKAGIWTTGGLCEANIDNTYTRTITLTLDDINKQMTVVSTVTWIEGSNIRKSELTSILTQWR